MRKIILLDMDNTIMDFSGGLVRAYNERYEDQITLDMLDTWELQTTGALHPVNDLWMERDFFLHLDLLNDAGEWVPKIAEKYDCYICSHAHQLSYAEKELSLQRHFGNLFHDKIIFTKHKHLINGDILLDDKVEMLFDFANEKRTSVCYNGHHNTVRDDREVNWHGLRVNSMQEFYEMLKII